MVQHLARQYCAYPGPGLLAGLQNSLSPPITALDTRNINTSQMREAGEMSERTNPDMDLL